MKRKRMAGIISGTLALTLLLVGCSQNEGNISNPQSGGSGNGTMKNYGASISVADIKNAYNAANNSDIMPLYNVSPDESFDFNFKANWFEKGDGLNAEDLVTVHTDPSCSEKSKLYTSEDFNLNENGGTKLTISPIGGVLTTDSEEYNTIEKDIEVWGNASMYYIAIWYNTEADDFVKLEKPIVIPFTINHELAIPTVKGVVDNTGRFKLTWNKVEGATGYNIYSYGNTDINSTGSVNKKVAGAESAYDVNGECHIIKYDTTTETEFDNFSGNGHGLAVHRHNELDEDDTDYIIGQNYCVNGAFFVTAIFGDEESGLSNMVETSDLILPYKIVDEEDIMFEMFDLESDLPQSVNVLNIDGSSTERKVNYKFHWSKTIAGDAYPCYRYSIEGTAITGEVSMNIEKVDYSDKQEGDAPTGFVENSSGTSAKADPENETSFNPDSEVPTIIENNTNEPDNNNSEDKTLVERQTENTEKHVENGNNSTIENTKYTVFADSPEEEWLARNLIAGNTEISIEAFPSIQQYETLMDVFQKVYYQNPYILGVTSYKYNYATFILEVNYCYDKAEIEKKQAEIQTESDKIIKEIIKNSMTDEEKCRIVYDYFNNNTTYDNAAVEAAENNNFTKGEDWNEYEDAFNAYGIIVNKKGVCQSYALSYKLLCSMCEVENKVITGHLNGSLPHAWNSVKLDNEWYQIDCTNNSTNCGIPFFLYEAGKDDLMMTGYTEDKLYDLDTAVGLYAVDNSNKEYYEINGLYATNTDEFKTVLNKCLENPSNAITIRFIGENITQEELVKAVQEVYSMKGMEDKLSNLGLAYSNSFIILISQQ